MKEIKQNNPHGLTKDELYIKEQEKIYNREKELKKQIISATIKNLTKK